MATAGIFAVIGVVNHTEQHSGEERSSALIGFSKLVIVLYQPTSGKLASDYSAISKTKGITLPQVTTPATSHGQTYSAIVADHDLPANNDALER